MTTHEPGAYASVLQKEPVLGPIADRYNCDLLLFTGTASNTRIYEFARAAAKDSRELIVLYFADCDPWGWSMPIDMARKLQALKLISFSA